MGKNAQQSSKNKASMQRLARKQKELKRAEIKIENGTYGICQKSGELIDEDRLKAMPVARFALLENA